jgi:hypothetical protein
MNLRGLFSLATLGERVGVELWKYQTEDGRSIRKALDFLIPFALEEKKWPYQQLGQFPAQELFPLLRRATLVYSESSYMNPRISDVKPQDRSNLLRPKAASPK